MTQVHVAYITAGYISALLGSVQLIPQIILIYKTGNVSDLSLAYLLMRFVSVLLGTVYTIGLALVSDLVSTIPAFISIFFSIATNIVLLYFKLVKFPHKNEDGYRRVVAHTF
jgi:uncharacterized protein with PQ loop repeat